MDFFFAISALGPGCGSGNLHVCPLNSCPFLTNVSVGNVSRGPVHPGRWSVTYNSTKGVNHSQYFSDHQRRLDEWRQWPRYYSWGILGRVNSLLTPGLTSICATAGETGLTEPRFKRRSSSPALLSRIVSPITSSLVSPHSLKWALKLPKTNTG